MRQRIFRSISTVALTVLLLSFALIFGLLYGHFTKLQEEELRFQTELAAAGLQSAGEAYFESLRGDGKSRFTWIAADGSVLYDTLADPSSMENHRDREEFQEALKTGYGQSSRYSVTLAQKTLYMAKRLEDQSVIRLCITENSALVLLFGLLFPFFLILSAAVLLSSFLAAQSAKRIVEPLNRIDLEDPLSNKDVYEELSPLLFRMELQQRQIRLQLAALDRKQEEFEAITDSMQEGLILLNACGNILSINRSAMVLYETDKGCIGKDFLNLDRSLPMQTLLERAKAGKGGELRKSFGSREYQLDLSPILREGTVQGAVLLLFDITEKALAESLRREFTANVSHELKTPLQTIAGSAEILLNGLVKAEDTERFIARIYKDAKRMIALIEDIIRLSKLDETEESREALLKEPVALLPLAKDLSAELQSSAAAKNVELSVSGEETTIHSVLPLVREILYNLTDNAIKYNREGGSVEIRILPDGFRVKDTGIGIPLSEQERIFERFYRVDKSHSRKIGGTGLGLSIVKHAALRLGARVELESREGEGSCFTVRFEEA